MKRFVDLYIALDTTNKTSAKVDAMAQYFATTPPEDAIWGLYFLTGRRPRRPVNTSKLWGWALELSGLPSWLFSESYDAVGDLAETIAMVVNPVEGPESPIPQSGSYLREGVGGGRFPEGQPASPDQAQLHTWIEDRLLRLTNLPEDEQREVIEKAWSDLDRNGRFVYNKLITGGFRVGVSQDLVIRALSQASQVPAPVVAHRLTGHWEPTADFFQKLVGEDQGDADISKPYPFCLAHPLQADLESIGPREEWHAEWKWDGIRSQVIRRQGHTFVWSRGEELISERFPEIKELGDLLPEGTALDGEIMAWQGAMPLPFGDLQKRIGRKIVGKKLLADVPVVLVVYDLLEWKGEDLREMPFQERRKLLAGLVSDLRSQTLLPPPTIATESGPAIRLSEDVEAASWEELAEKRLRSRELNVEGLMLKHRDSPYVVGRKKGYWWKWKIEPYSVDAVLIYAARGSGIRASLYTDYTFGVWHEGALVPFAKAYSGLTNDEIRQVDAWVRRNTVEKFGPVRTVKPELVFELAFEDIRPSNRHKSGIAVRFPRIARWRQDKKPEDADSIDTVKALLNAHKES